ncbi:MULTISPECIES: ABC transporter permease [unclassified Symbiopectobacterium]|uniref:ABC transporter permease n=1 Tax=unclassified Symbiopectobacterium TaxID=2794573 RepID=UPI002227E126|nr:MULTISPECIES: ABC transporter permease [unclassified Symbiopectobacterium]MCW2474797.1 ABC transporter permease [Candidatus Symbiopectobacterium sp. NZEC151]MCW2487475.1 ABC transporter permease [Candidatus Symbiopectobacterium sp. NZEC127]
MTNETVAIYQPTRFSPLTQRRARLFFSNRKVVIACVLWLLLIVIGLFADAIATDKPWLLKYDGNFYFPLLFDYPETTFGGTLPTLANYSDPQVQHWILSKGYWVRAPVPWTWETIDIANTQTVPSPPSSRHWLGTDDAGRDVLARVIYGIRISLLFAMIVSTGAVVLGTLIGGIQGYWGGRVDLYGQRFIEIWAGLPTLFMLMILSSMVTPSLGWLTLTMVMFSWLSLVDIVRAEFLRTRNQDYVVAATLMGLPARTVMWRHILPNAMISTLTFLPFTFTGAITTLTSLDFLGFGLPPGSASLGELINQARNNPQATWLAVTAFFSLTLLLSLMVFIGEGLRDAFDPRYERRQ